MYTLNDHPIGFEEYCRAPTRDGGWCHRRGHRSSTGPAFRCHQHKGYVPEPEPLDENSYVNRLNRYLDGTGSIPHEVAPEDPR